MRAGRSARPHTIGGAAEIGFCETREAGKREGGSGADQQLTSGEALFRSYRNRHAGNLRQIATKVAGST